MTLRKKFENILHDWIDKDYNRDHIAEVLEVEVDEFSMGFAEWCRDNAVRETTYSTEFTNNWELRYEQKIITTKKLLEIYKNEKGL